jgi:hypothetical protein
MASAASLVDEAKRGNGAQVAALLAARLADPNACDVRGNTPLHHAVDKGACVRACLCVRVHVRSADCVGPGYVDIVRTLVEHGANPNLAELEHVREVCQDEALHTLTERGMSSCTRRYTVPRLWATSRPWRRCWRAPRSTSTAPTSLVRVCVCAFMRCGAGRGPGRD